MEKNLKIYVAGHRGMVGSAIVRNLEKQGYTNIITRTRDQLDLRRQAQVEEFFEKEQIDYVFLAAAKVGGIMANESLFGGSNRKYWNWQGSFNRRVSPNN